ncbi:MAG: aminoacyl-histidine dipeptidase [Saprospiraceae bacterium]|nr:aminoacyl-histidine dipeptidase [Saprospiraceae bacterium]
MTSIKDIEPIEVWKHFADLNGVPRASKSEDRVRAFMIDFAGKNGLSHKIDGVGNVLITKDATLGMENRKPIVLQAHLDMVHQKNTDTVFNFDQDGIDMYVDGDWVKARGTTLGADNGLGVASIMAILASKEITHPALEALFTIDEETGMTGALGLEGGWLNGEILLNLDTEDDDEIDIGCAGGLDVTARRSYTEVVCPAINIGREIKIKGLAGGHSGMDIHKGLGNANKLMNRMLYHLCTGTGAMVRSITGGGLRNAIPRESVSALSLHPDTLPAFTMLFNKIKAEIMAEYKNLEPDLSIMLDEIEAPSTAMDPLHEIQVIKAIYAAHNGVYRMSPGMEDLVEASNNIARVEVAGGKASILCLTRSSVESSKNDVANGLKSVFELAGFDCEFSGAYPGWTPDLNSQILGLVKDVYLKLNGSYPRVVSCHAGLECGILGRNYPHMEMISFGPTIKGAHSPDERASISSLRKFWALLQAVLKEIPLKAA